MDPKEAKKAAKELCQNFERYRPLVSKYNINDLEDSLGNLRKDTSAYFVNKWYVGVLRKTLLINEYADKLTPENSENFKKIYPGIYNKRQYSLENKRVAKRSGVSEGVIKSKKKAIFKEIIEMQNASH